MSMGRSLGLAAVISAALGTPHSGGRARWLCDAAREVLDVDGVSLALPHRHAGARALLAATDDITAAIEAADDVLGIGPTYVAGAGTAVLLRPETAAPPWGALVAQFSNAPAPRWVLAVPARDRDVVVATLLVHTDRPDVVQQAQWVGEVAEAVVIMLTARQPEEWLEPALAAGDLTNQAIGMLMAEHTIDAHSALDVLRSHAFTAGSRLDVAALRVLDAARGGR